MVQVRMVSPAKVLEIIRSLPSAMAAAEDCERIWAAHLRCALCFASRTKLAAARPLRKWLRTGLSILSQPARHRCTILLSARPIRCSLDGRACPSKLMSRVQMTTVMQLKGSLDGGFGRRTRDATESWLTNARFAMKPAFQSQSMALRASVNWKGLYGCWRGLEDG